jgi:peptide/nickel transport system permease protein
MAAATLQSFPGLAGATYRGLRIGVNTGIPGRRVRDGPGVCDRFWRTDQRTMTDAFAYVGRRLLQLFLVLFVAGTINFIIPRLLPGDPVATAVAKMQAGGGSNAINAEELAKVWNAKFGLDQPLWNQYVNYWTDLAKGDLGISVLSYPQPVTEKISVAILWSVGLLTVATIIAFGVGSVLGALLLWPRAPRAVGWFASPLLLLSTVPYYLLAIVLIYVFAILFKWFPPSQGFSPTTILGFNLKSAQDIAYHAILPALSIVLGAVGFWALGMRSLMVNVMGEDYITYAESKGLSQRRIFFRYGMRNAMLPQVTALALALATVVSGAVLVEAIFNYPGLGGLLFTSVLGKDIFVVNGVVIVLIVSLAVAVFIIDLIYPLLDPRIRRQSA